jgi:hypothetical protein
MAKSQINTQRIPRQTCKGHVVTTNLPTLRISTNLIKAKQKHNFRTKNLGSSAKPRTDHPNWLDGLSMSYRKTVGLSVAYRRTVRESRKDRPYFATEPPETTDSSRTFRTDTTKRPSGLRTVRHDSSDHPKNPPEILHSSSSHGPSVMDFRTVRPSLYNKNHATQPIE